MKIFHEENRFRLLFGGLALLSSLYSIVHSVLIYPYDMISVVFFNCLFVGWFFFVGWVLDKGLIKTGLVLGGITFAIVPWLSGLTIPTSTMVSPYNFPWALLFLLPESMMSGHPPAGIFIVSLFWIILGIGAAAYYREKK